MTSAFVLFVVLNLAVGQSALTEDELSRGVWLEVSDVKEMNQDWLLYDLNWTTPTLSPEQNSNNRIVWRALGGAVSVILLLFLTLILFLTVLNRKPKTKKISEATKETAQNLDEIYEAMVQAGQGAICDQNLMTLFDFETVDYNRILEECFPDDFNAQADRDKILKGRISRYELFPTER